MKPKSANAATTLLLMGGISIAMLSSIIFLSRVTGVQMGGEGFGEFVRNGVPVGDSYTQDTVIGQLAKTVFELSLIHI